MEIQIAVAKINQFGSEESGDTLEVVERPAGGYSVVMCDAQASGKIAKSISAMVVRKVINLLAEGVRDGAAARAASDYLFTERAGQVSAFLNILSADLETSTLVISRNNPTPIFISQGERVECLTSSSESIGLARNIRPAITELPLEQGMIAVMYTDGIATAGQRNSQEVDICLLLEGLLEEMDPSAQEIADRLLMQALRLDQNQPNDDMSVVALKVSARVSDPIRRMNVRLPVIRTKLHTL